MKKTHTAKSRPASKPAGSTLAVTWTEQKALWLILIPVLTFIVYNSVTSFDMTNWDDKHYLKEQPIVRGLTTEHVKQMFTTKVLASYNPIVLMTFAFDYDMARLKPGWCHGINMFFHILNALLVFACMKKLRFRNSESGMIALLFAIHPFASEAVAWIASRKDVVYAFFFFLSWYFYLSYRDSKKTFQFVLSLLFFTLSLFSKVQAITLPLVLIISDYLLDREWKTKAIINKIPFLLLSITFGIVALSGSTFAADKYAQPLSFGYKAIYSIIAYGLYIGKIYFPFWQTAIYTFPEPGSSGLYAMLAAGAILTGLVITLLIVRFKSAPRVAAGILFFSVNIFIVLHMVAVNSALIYERFIYIADIGIFMTLFGADEVNPNWKKFRVWYVPVFIIVCGILTMQRIQVWKNSDSLWTDVIAKNPNAADAHTNRGQYFASIGDEQKALEDYNESIRLKPNKPDGYNNRSIIYFNRKDWKHSLEDNLNVLRVDSTHTDGLVNRGAIYFNMDLLDSAIYYYGKALAVSPRHAKAYYDRGASYYKQGKYKESIADYEMAIKIIPDYADAFAYLALDYVQLGDYEKSELAILSSEKYNPTSGARQMCSNELIHKGNVAYAGGQEQQALDQYLRAGEIWPQNSEAYYNVGGIYLMRKDIQSARKYWKKTLEINPSHPAAKDWLMKTGGE